MMEGEAPFKATETAQPQAQTETGAEVHNGTAPAPAAQVVTNAGLSATAKALLAGLALAGTGILVYGLVGNGPAPVPEERQSSAAPEAGVTGDGGQLAAELPPLKPEQKQAATVERDAQEGAGLQEEARPQAAEQAAPEEIAPPSITTWAVSEEGIATIAGLAHPLSSVQILRDGAEVEKTKATAGGEFAVVTTLAPSPAPSFLTLRIVLEDGRSFLSQSGVALGPIAGPKPVAAQGGGSENPEPDASQNQPAALLVSDAGAVVLQAPSAQGEAPQSGLSLAAITYTPEGAVQLSGMARPSSLLQLYLDNASLQQVEVAASGQWLSTLPEIAPGRYMLRIDEIDSAGTVSARIETPFERETLARLGAVSAQTIADRAAEPAAVAPEAPQPDAGEPAPAAPKAPVSITVQPGHSLWAIARDQLGSGVLYVQVLEANRDLIRNPDLIYPGQVFNLPKAE